jgi:hypothetical protein
LIGRKILDSAVNEVLEALSVHVAPPAIQIVVVPAGVTVLLGPVNHHVDGLVRWVPPYPASL